jgi:hypothetical protein
MASGFQPLSALDPDWLVEYLGREGHAAEEVRWKYFDSRFNRNRERGYAWVKDGKIGGFLGLIPFQVVVGDRVADAAWTCDWSVQDPTARGIGILLIRQAQDKYEFLTQLGGNEATQRIISRLSSKTVNDAGIVFHLPLRLGAMLRVAGASFRDFQQTFSGSSISCPCGFRAVPAGIESVMFEPESLKPWEIWSLLNAARSICAMISSTFSGRSAIARSYFWDLHHCERSRTAPRRDLEAKRFRWTSGASLCGRAKLRRRGKFLVSSVIRRSRQQRIFAVLCGVAPRSVCDQTAPQQGFLAAPRRQPLHIIASRKAGEPVRAVAVELSDTDYAYRF